MTILKLIGLGRGHRKRRGRYESYADFTRNADFTITVATYPIPGDTAWPIYEISLTRNGNNVPISSVKVDSGGQLEVSSEFVEARGETYVLEVIDKDGKTYRPSGPVAVK